jgi:hypothetical protein
MRIYLTEEENKLFMERYVNHTNKELMVIRILP